MTAFGSINWADPASNVSEFFSVRECLSLPRLGRLALYEEAQPYLSNIWKMAQKMDAVRREFGDNAIRVHCWLRPPDYNHLVGGAKNSAHLVGLAVDFDIHNTSCSDATAHILSKGLLDSWHLRMEQGTADRGWIHLDARDPGPSGRFFKP